MISYTIPGYFSTTAAEKIKQTLQGKTYMDFIVEYGGIGTQNQVITIATTGNFGQIELAEMMIHVSLSELAKSL